jgi:hypothetical protein
MYASGPEEIREWIADGAPAKRAASETWRKQRDGGALKMPAFGGSTAGPSRSWLERGFPLRLVACVVRLDQLRVVAIQSKDPLHCGPVAPVTVGRNLRVTHDSTTQLLDDSNVFPESPRWGWMGEGFTRFGTIVRMGI